MTKLVTGVRVTDAQKEDKLRAVGKEADWKTYCESRDALAMMEKLPGMRPEGLAAMRKVIDQYEEQWTQYFLGNDRASPQLRERVGYTRVSALPLVEREKTKGNKVEMPVRLNLFGRTDSGQGHAKHPVYCIKQENEAFYVKLNEEVVLEWLRVNGMAVDLGTPPIRFGGKLIEEFPANTFSRFLDDYRKEKSVTRAPYPYVYTLLTSAAMRAVHAVDPFSPSPVAVRSSRRWMMAVSKAVTCRHAVRRAVHCPRPRRETSRRILVGTWDQ